MTLVVQDAAGAKQNMSTTLDASNNLVGATCMTDPVSGQKAQVAQFHNADNQNPGGSAYGLLTGGVAQLLNILGNLDRQREAGVDGVSASGIASGAASFAMAFKTTSGSAISTGNQIVTPAVMSGTIGGVPWSIMVGSVLAIDTGASREIVLVTAVTSTTFTATFGKTHSTTPVAIIGFVYNQERDASGENDGASGSGTAVAAEYEFNAGDPSGGNFDRARSINAKGLATQSISAGGGAGSVSLSVGASTGLQPAMKVLLYKASTFPAAGSFESVNVDLSFIPGSTTVPLASAIVGSPVYDTLAYDSFSALAPAAKKFLPFGVGIESLALADAVSGLMYGVQNAPGHQGAVYVSSDGAKATYHTYFNLVPAATPTDVFTIAGSSSKTVRIKKIVLSGAATAAGQFLWFISRRSSPNTGGTTGAITGIKHDINDPAATATATYYTANPTSTGTLVGNVRGVRLFHNVNGGQNDRAVMDFSTNQDKALILRGATDVIAINGNGGTLPTGSVLDVEIAWEEDNS